MRASRQCLTLADLNELANSGKRETLGDKVVALEKAAQAWRQMADEAKRDLYGGLFNTYCAKQFPAFETTYKRARELMYLCQEARDIVKCVPLRAPAQI
jgi:hypothetical protein